MSSEMVAVTPDAETVLGHVQCHCNDPEDGVPDVGVSIGLGEGCSLWIGELLNRDGGDIGIVFHGPDGRRIAAPMWPSCEWQEAADIIRHHVGPVLDIARQQAEARATSGAGEVAGWKPPHHTSIPLDRSIWQIDRDAAAMLGLFHSTEDAVQSFARHRREVDLLASLIGNAVLGVTDDYMTSETHHPDYILIPVAKFEQLRDAEAVINSGGRAETFKSATADDTPHLQAVEPEGILCPHQWRCFGEHPRGFRKGQTLYKCVRCGLTENREVSPTEAPGSEGALREALEASLAKRAPTTVGRVYANAFNAALHMVACDTAPTRLALNEGEG